MFKSVFVYLLFSLIFNSDCISQRSIEEEVHMEQTELANSSIQLYATNKRNYAQIIQIKFRSLKNMESTSPLPIKTVLKANENKVLITTLIPDLNKEYGFDYEIICYPGETLDPVIDKDFIYTLPFEQGKSYNVGQGYDGSYSHNMNNRTYAIDFDMPKGAKVCAARGGKVFSVKQDSDRRGKTISSSKYANYITILHEDGSFANYYHLQQNGSLVKEGDNVNVGDVIGLSGNTGWSDGPHLHFEVYYFDNKGDMVSFPTKFYLTDKKPGILKERNIYSR